MIPKEETKKVEDEILNVKDKIKAAAEERKKRSQQIIDDGNKQINNVNDNTNSRSRRAGIKVNYVPDYDGNTINTKRRQDVLIPFQDELIGICLTCGCSIF